MTTVFGWIGSVISLIYKMPQLYLLYREKKHEGLSLTSILIQSFSYLFYILHGYFIEDAPVFYMGIACLVQSICLIIMYFAYKKASLPDDHSESESEPEAK